jgi:uncharacterized membrane protein YraQ (UPF0718 family)
MMSVISGIALECWKLLNEAAPYVLLGFFAAGMLKAFVSEEFVASHLGHRSFGSVIKASLFGIPVPLCSCGVIPAAIGLRKHGASRGASAAFLISTPETGLDSIAITWALLDPIMTIARPVAACITATLTGLFVNLLPLEPSLTPAKVTNPEHGSCSNSCCGEAPTDSDVGVFGKLRGGLAFAFGDLLGDIGKWLLIGIVISGILAYFVPADFFTRFLGNEFLSLLAMLAIGVPLYICASASTPIAVVLVLKGLSPGAALVFLLAGPATNAATLTVIGRFLGKKVTVIYLATIAVCSVALGWLVNRVYDYTDFSITEWVGQSVAEAISPFTIACSVVLLILITRSLLPKGVARKH